VSLRAVSAAIGSPEVDQLGFREGKNVKQPEEIMEILEAYDLTGSYRAAAELAGCDHHTVARYVAMREAGRAPERMRAERVADPFLAKIEEWVERSRGRIGADVCHRKLAAMGYAGSERTTRRAVATAKRAWRSGQRRVYRPWLPEPGLWMQFDWGEGPAVAGMRTQLWCAWLAWCRFRVVLAAVDKTLPTLLACLDQTLRRFGGVPTYVLTDNEKTVTVEHIATIPVRHPQIVAAARHYGLTIATCVPADPESKGGSEATVRIAKRDLLPTQVNLRSAYRSFAELEQACASFCGEVNARPHRETGRPPAEMLAEERARLHRVPDAPLTTVFGETRKVMWDSTISVGGVRYSVPSGLIDERVWVRLAGDELVVTHVGAHGPTEVARHRRSVRGRPSIKDEHYPPRPPGALGRVPRARTGQETAFLAIGEGATLWLTEAAAAGATRVRAKMAEAVTLAKLHGAKPVDRALGAAAAAGRFADGDLQSILAHQQRGPTGEPQRASETHSLQPGTSSWAKLGGERP
jgi:transposase